MNEPKRSVYINTINPFGIVERKAKDDDFRFFAGLIESTIGPYVRAYFPFNKDYVKNGFSEGKKSIIILLKGKRRIGFYQLKEINKSTVEIARFFLRPRYQGLGIGSFYLKSFEALGYRKLTLSVWDNNPARFLYKKLGYKAVSKKAHKISMQKVIR